MNPNPDLKNKTKRVVPAFDAGRSVPKGSKPATEDIIGNNCYSICLIGPLSLGVSLGVQVMMTVLMRWGISTDKTAFWDQLTEHGKSAAQPEREMPIYAAAVIFALGIVMLNWLWWQKQIKKISARQVNGYMTFSALLQGFAAAISMAVYLLLLFAYHFSRLSYAGQNTAREPLGQLAVITLLLPALMAVAWVVFDTKRYLHLSKFPERGGQKGLRMSKFLLCATPVFIVLIVGVWPRAWTYLAGRIYQADQFHHLNFYMMAPALAFAHGKAFAIEIYSQYGIGWPLVVSGLSHFSAMTYANALGLIWDFPFGLSSTTGVDSFL